MATEVPAQGDTEAKQDVAPAPTLVELTSSIESLIAQGQLDEAEAQLAAMARASLPSFGEFTAREMELYLRSQLMFARGDREACEEALRLCLRLSVELHGDACALAVRMRASLASVLSSIGDTSAERNTAPEILDLWRANYAAIDKRAGDEADDVLRLECLQQLGNACHINGLFDEALGHRTELVALARSLQSADEFGALRVHQARLELAETRALASGDAEATGAELRSIVDELQATCADESVAREVRDEATRLRAVAATRLAQALSGSQPAEAARLLQAVCDDYVAAGPGPDERPVLEARMLLAAARVQAAATEADVDAAESMFSAVLADVADVYGRSSPPYLRAQSSFASVLLPRRPETALSLLRAVAAAEAAASADPSTSLALLPTLSQLCDACVFAGDATGALEASRRMETILAAHAATEPEALATVGSFIAKLQSATPATPAKPAMPAIPAMPADGTPAPAKRSRAHLWLLPGAVLVLGALLWALLRRGELAHAVGLEPDAEL